MFSSHLTIAGVDFSISSGHRITDSCPYSAYSEFVSVAGGMADVSIPVTLDSRPVAGLSDFRHCFDSGDMWTLFRDGETRYIVHTSFGLESPMWAAEIDLDVSSADIHCGGVLLNRESGSEIKNPAIENQPLPDISSPMRYPLDQILMTYVLARRQGLLLHSAGVMCRGKLWLLAGKSRAGKSTASLLLKGREGIELLSDDRIVVRKIGSEFIGYGTPWPGEARIAANRSAPLAGILFLDQSPLNQIDEIDASDAFEKLMPITSVPWYEPELFPTVMDFCGMIAENLPMLRLQFRPDKDAADMIERKLKG